MPYWLGIDLGTTYTAAATADASGRTEILTLGGRTTAVPSVVFVEGATTVVGDAANRRALTEPGRVARQFKRRLGDPTPLLLGGSPVSAQSLMARVLRWVHDQVEAERGERPEGIAVTHPANWGPYKLDLLDQAIRLADLPGARILTEPEAAAVSYADAADLDPGDVVAVYDLGGGTFDAAILRCTHDGFELVGRPEGVEHLGGIDIDEAVFEIVRSRIGAAFDALDDDDPATVAAVARLRQDCVDAKEALSTDIEARIPVLLPGVQTEVAVSRTELEEVATPMVRETVGALQRALESARLRPDQVTSVLLVGGSSRMPLVARLVGEALGRPVSVDAHPKHAIARGAALVAAGRAGVAASRRATLTTMPPVPEPATAPPAATPTPMPPAASGDPVGTRRTARPQLLLAAAAVAVVVVGAVVVTRGGGDQPAAGTGVTTTGDLYGARPGGTVGDGGPSTTVDPSLPAVTPGPSGRGVRIDDVEIVRGTYHVSYRTVGYDPELSEDPGTHHLHFFFDDTAAEHAGQQSATPGRWVLWDVPSPFTGYRVADRPNGANRICALVADHVHNVELGSGNCVPLPTL